MSNLKFEFTVNQPQRIDTSVLQSLSEEDRQFWTRSKIQNYIEQYGLTHNGTVLHKASFKARVGDTVQLDWPLNLQQLDSNLTSKIAIVAETNDYILINKPPGLVVHSGAGHTGDTLADWLAATFQEQASIQDVVNQDTTYPTPHLGGGMVHRLDKDSQGLMLIARNVNNLHFFQNQFRSRSVVKKYLTVLIGQFNKHVELSGFQARIRRNILKQLFTLQDVTDPQIEALIAKQAPIKGDWRTSQSTFTPLVHCPELNQTLVEVEIFTGRMHQIRTQAEFLGFPLWQDPLYKIPLQANLERLHSEFPSRIQLSDVTIESQSKPKFQELIANIFDFPERVSFYLMSNYLQFLDLNQGNQSYQINWVK